MKNLKSNYLAILFTITLFSCNEKPKKNLWLWEGNFYGTPITDKTKYFSEKIDSLRDVSPRLKNEVTLIFCNNPYLLDSTYYLKIHNNYRIIYAGKFYNYLKINTFVTDDLDSKIAAMGIEIAKNGKSYHFDRDKAPAVPWRKHFTTFNIIFSSHLDRYPVDYFFR